MKVRSFIVLLVATVLFVFNSCKKETVDVTELLKSVPSSAAGVVVFNMESLLEDAGCKIKDHRVTPGKDILNYIEKSNPAYKDYMLLFDGGTGIEPKGALLFYDSNRIYLTFALYDVNKFCEFIENQNGSKFTNENNGVKVNGNVAVKGAQGWICISKGKRLDSDAIASYSSLETSQSFLVTPMGEKLLVEENDIRGWAIINTFLNEILSRSDRSMVTLGLGFLFEDSESVKFKVDFKKGELEAEALVLNSKGKPAKYLLPSEKIDIETIKQTGSTCDALMAFTINSKLIKKFEQIGNAFGGSLFGDLGETLKNIDGTVGIISSGEGTGESISGIITTKGEVSKTLRDLISQQIAPVSVEGKYLKFSKGDVKGSLDVAECAEELKGCCLGIAVDPTGYNSIKYEENAPTGLKNMYVKFKPESGGLEVEIEVKTNDPNENSLLTVLKR